MRGLPVVLGLLPLCWAGEASALPAFARKYTAPCALCHAPAYPALNAAGRRFLANGYQLDPPAEAAFRAATSRTPDPEARLSLLDQLPLALRAQSAAVVTPDPRNAGPGQNALDLQPFETLYLLAGASIYPDVSFLASATLAPGPAIHQAAVGLHNLLSPEGYLNLRFGRLLLLGFLRPEHRFLTGYPSPITSTPVGLNPTTLEATQHGVEVFGRLLGRRLFYHLALVQGAQAEDGVRDLDGYKDLFGELQVIVHHRLTLGALGYRGRTQILDAARGVQVRFTDAFYMAGASAELDTAPLNLFAQALYVNHANPFGTGEHADYWGFRVAATAPLGPRFFLVARYDQLGSHHLEEQDLHPRPAERPGGPGLKHATLHLGYLLLANLRLAAESDVPLDSVEATTLSLRLDVAF